jgi:hypothetical protein
MIWRHDDAAGNHARHVYEQGGGDNGCRTSLRKKKADNYAPSQPTITAKMKSLLDRFTNRALWSVEPAGTKAHVFLLQVSVQGSVLHNKMLYGGGRFGGMCIRG